MASKSDVILGAWAEFFVSHALAIRAIEEDMDGHSPLTIDEYDVLLAISRAPGQRLRFSNLAETTVYTKSGITRIIKRFALESFVTRESCPEDKRGSFAVITDHGKKALRESWRWYSKGILKVFGECYSEREAEQLAGLLKKLADSLSGGELLQVRPTKH